MFLELKEQGFELRFKPGDEIKPGDLVGVSNEIGVEKRVASALSQR